MIQFWMITEPTLFTNQYEGHFGFWVLLPWPQSIVNLWFHASPRRALKAQNRFKDVGKTWGVFLLQENLRHRIEKNVENQGNVYIHVYVYMIIWLYVDVDVWVPYRNGQLHPWPHRCLPWLFDPSIIFGVWGSRYIETHLFTNQNMGIVWATLVCGFNHIILFHPGAEVGFTKMPVNNPGYFMANVCSAVCRAVACRSIVLTSSYFIPGPLFLPGSVEGKSLSISGSHWGLGRTFTQSDFWYIEWSLLGMDTMLLWRRKVIWPGPFFATNCPAVPPRIGFCYY